MKRECTHCGRPYVERDLAGLETTSMESERTEAGVEGVRFAYYRCPCGMNDIYVDVLPFDGEFREDFHERISELDAVARRMAGDNIRAIIVAASN